MHPQKIRTFLWYDNCAEEAATFYCSLFGDSNVVRVDRYPEGSPAPAGTAMTVLFQLAGVEIIALNGGPHFKFNEAISLCVDCESQAEIDDLWSKLATGGEPSRCGWLKDPYGLSWQIIPKSLPKLISGPKSGQVMQALMGMTKIDIAALQKAAE